MDSRLPHTQDTICGHWTSILKNGQCNHRVQWLGPLLYALYTNDMSLVVRKPACTTPAHLSRSTLFGVQCSDCGILSNYADDSTYTVASKSRNTNQVNLRRNLDEIECYLTDNKLKINLGKTSLTECMIPQKKGKPPGNPPSLLVQGRNQDEDKLVEYTSYTRILGANLQANLGWLAHLETGEKAVLPRVRRQLGLLKHQGNLIPKSCRINLARSLVLSKLCYLMPLWGGGHPQHI